MQLSFKDIWLSYFVNRQSLLTDLMSGDKLTVKRNYCYDSKGQAVLGFFNTNLLTNSLMDNADIGFKEPLCDN